MPTEKNQAELEIEALAEVFNIATTGACAAGVKCFVEGTGKSLEDAYTAKEIAKIVKGQYGAEKFTSLALKGVAA